MTTLKLARRFEQMAEMSKDEYEVFLDFPNDKKYEYGICVYDPELDYQTHVVNHMPHKKIKQLKKYFEKNGYDLYDCDTFIRIQLNY